MESVRNAHQLPDFRKTNALVIMYLVNIIKLKEAMEPVKIAQLTQDHVQTTQVKKCVRQTSAAGGRK